MFNNMEYLEAPIPAAERRRQRPVSCADAGRRVASSGGPVRLGLLAYSHLPRFAVTITSAAGCAALVAEQAA